MVPTTLCNVVTDLHVGEGSGAMTAAQLAGLSHAHTGNMRPAPRPASRPAPAVPINEVVEVLLVVAGLCVAGGGRGRD